MINTINEAINRKLASMSFTNIITGKVESLNPLKVRINDRIVIGQSFIEPMSLGLNDYSPSSALPLYVGETIQLIRYNNGQRFYVLGKSSGEAKIDEVDYTTQVVNKPKLVTVVADPLEPGEEPIAEEVLLHKIAKSGCYNDLCMKPKINTTSTSSLDVNEAEELNETIELHKVSKTGNYNHLVKRPQINGHTLTNNKTADDLGLQEKLEAGINVKNINGESILGQGNIVIQGGSGGGTGYIDTLPIGTMIPYGSAETPANWLSCDGRAVSRVTYKELFEVIGTSYGAGDGSTTFNLPDKRGRVSVGYDPAQTMFNTVGAHVGANTHTLTIDEMPNHNHTGIYENYSEKQITTRGDGGGGWNSANITNPDFSQNDTYSFLYTGSKGGGKAHSIVQASEVDHWIIKAYPSSNPDGLLDPLPVGTIVEYDGEEVPDGFEEIQELESKQRWHYQSEFKYNSITNNTWSLLAPFVTTEKLPKGNYLVLYNVGLYAGGTGTVTINAGFDGERLDLHRRASMPLTSSLITNTEVTHYFELEEDRAVTLSAYAYSNANCSINSLSVDIIRLDCEEMGLVIDNAQEYSNDEKIIGTWNGKKLYRRKFEYMGLSANAENVIGTIDNADEVYIEEAHLITTNDAKLSYPLNMVGYAGNVTDKVYAYAQNGYIKVHTTGGWGSNAWKVVVVAKYTKTTD